jgi:hypothetical protein
MTPTAESKTHVDAQLSQILELGLNSPGSTPRGLGARRGPLTQRISER